MKLDQITADIRLRSVWEAVDLGFLMVQEWWKAIYLPLGILTLCIALPLFLFFPVEQYWIIGLIFWWFKPLYDRLVLHIISHKLFNDELNATQALRALPSLIWNTGFFQSMTLRRFSLSRGFNLPIWQLEQLRGKQRAERQRVLHVAAHSQAVWLTICMWLMELILLLSLFVLLIMFIPPQIAGDFLDGVFSGSRNSETAQLWIALLNVGFYVLVVTFLHPFYIAGNFSLYINRRTQLEAWDIELDFRKMSQRFEMLAKTGMAAVLLFAATQLAILPSPVSADEIQGETPTSETLANERKPPQDSKHVIQEVMKNKNLDDKKKVMRWVTKPRKQTKQAESNMDWLFDWLEPVVKLIATLLESSLWIAIAIGIALLYVFRDRWLHLFQGSSRKKESYTAPDIMFGMDVRPESLPDDIIASARKLWRENKHRESLSLLYRGALAQLINQENVQLQDSFTEGDVLKHAAKKITPQKQSYLKLLTRQWRYIAYAHRRPDDAMENAMQTLFNRWASDFTAHSADPASKTHKAA